MTQAIIVFMAGEHEDAISRLDDLTDMVRFKSICYAVQACAQRTRGMSPLTFLTGTYAPSPWKITHGER